MFANFIVRGFVKEVNRKDNGSDSFQEKLRNKYKRKDVH
jgi:hypothetical protein